MAGYSNLNRFKTKKSKNKVLEWLVRRARLILLLMFLVLVICTLAVIVNWPTIKATWYCNQLNAVFEIKRTRAFLSLLDMNYDALPVLLKQAEEEENFELFQTKIQLIENLGMVHKLRPETQVKYYYTYIQKDAWENCMYSMKKLVEIGPKGVPYICEILKTAYPLYRYCSLCVLANIGDPSCSETVLPFIREEESIIRTKAFYALDSCGALKKHSDVLVKYICSEEYRSFDDTLKEYAIRILGKLQSPEIDKKMAVYLREGRPFETQMAAGYFALSDNMANVRKAMDFAVDIYIDPAFRLEVLNCLKTRLDDKELQKVLLEYLLKTDPESDTKILTAGLGRFIASQYFVVADIDEELMTQLLKLLESDDVIDEVKWDISVVLSYKDKKVAYKYLKEAIVRGSETTQYSRVAQLAAIALGESGTNEALKILVDITNNGDELARIRAIYWGLRVFGVNEGDWRLPKEALSVYPMLKKLSEDLTESTRIRGYAKKAIEELKNNPGQITGPKIVSLGVEKCYYPMFSSAGKHINEIIKENLNYYDFPEY